jgi:phosphoadenosine phosphosulfate reductase
VSSALRITLSTDFTLTPSALELDAVRPVSTLSLRNLAADAAERLAAAPAEEILRWAAETFGSRFCVASSMSDGVLAHLAARVMPGVDVLFLDTGYHFVETLGTRDAVDATLPVTVVTLSPTISVRQQDETLGPELFARDPDLCCALRKVQPFAAGLSSYDAWATGVRREQGGTRTSTPVVGYDEERGKVVVAPLARWTQADVDDYVAEHQVIVNPLRFDGYSSIGCWPCTRRANPGEDARSGRWPGSAKSECGIHS